VFGVRGVGTLFYLTYALSAGQFTQPATLWRVVGLVVIASIVLHGIGATPAMRLLDRRRNQAARHRHGDPDHPTRIPV
jgi:NhaP-type Na+/H+ or K+/H+ antiporter